jgi:hypothetical protein
VIRHAASKVPISLIKIINTKKADLLEAMPSCYHRFVIIYRQIGASSTPFFYDTSASYRSLLHRKSEPCNFPTMSMYPLSTTLSLRFLHKTFKNFLSALGTFPLSTVIGKNDPVQIPLAFQTARTINMFVVYVTYICTAESVNKICIMSI